MWLKKPCNKMYGGNSGHYGHFLDIWFIHLLTIMSKYFCVHLEWLNLKFQGWYDDCNSDSYELHSKHYYNYVWQCMRKTWRQLIMPMKRSFGKFCSIFWELNSLGDLFKIRSKYCNSNLGEIGFTLWKEISFVF